MSELLQAELSEGVSVSRAAKRVAAALGVPKGAVYTEALRLSGKGGARGDE